MPTESRCVPGSKHKNLYGRVENRKILQQFHKYLPDVVEILRSAVRDARLDYFSHERSTTGI